MDAPPKMLRDRVKSQVGECPVVPQDDNVLVHGSHGRLARRQESLPVLEAFQEFLDFERRRTRWRFLTLMTVFAALLLGLVLAGIFFGSVAVGRVKTSLAEFRSELDRERRTTQADLQNVALQTDDLQVELAGDRAALDDIRTTVVSSGTAFRNELTQLQGLVALLDVRNATLQTEVERLNLIGPIAGPIARPSPSQDTEGVGATEALDITLPLPTGETIPWRISLPR